MSGQEAIGKNEAYALMSKYLLKIQQKDGSWYVNDARLSTNADTAWTLLTLTRAPVLRKRESAKRGGDGVLETQTALPGLYFHVILDASGSMEKKGKGGRSKFDMARDAVETLLRKIPDEAAVGLRVYGHRKRAIDEGADEDTELVIPVEKAGSREVLPRRSARCGAGGRRRSP